jgi:hypothetical protein
VTCQHFFHLGGVDVLAAGDEHLLEPAPDPVITVGVTICNVAAAQSTVAHDGLGGGGVMPVAGEPSGNLVFRASARNFNPLCAMAAPVTVAEVESLVDVGQLDPDQVHLPGIFVQRVVIAGRSPEKPIERRTVRTKGGQQADDAQP